MRTTRWNLLRVRPGSIPVGSQFLKLKAIILAVVILALSLASHWSNAARLHHGGRMTMRSMMMLFAVAVPLGQEMLGPSFRDRLVKAFTESFSIESWTAMPMRRRPGSRHVFSCELIIGDQFTGKRRSIELVGKRDTKRGSGKAAKEFAAMRLLWDAGFGLDERFRIPRPVQYFSDLHLILQGKARGSKLRVFLGKANDTSLGHARMAGMWLAKLHGLKVSSCQICTYADEIASLRMFVGALAADQPKLSNELAHRAALLEQRFAGFQSVPAVMVHGDFHPDHIFVGKDSITVIDFERFSMSDPARDLGSFIAHTWTTASFSGRVLASANREIDAFLESYFTMLPLIQRIAIFPRIAPYVTLAAFEAYYYVASVLKVADPNRLATYVNGVRQAADFPAVPLSGLAECGEGKNRPGWSV